MILLFYAVRVMSGIKWPRISIDTILSNISWHRKWIHHHGPEKYLSLSGASSHGIYISGPGKELYLPSCEFSPYNATLDPVCIVAGEESEENVPGSDGSYFPGIRGSIRKEQKKGYGRCGVDMADRPWTLVGKFAGWRRLEDDYYYMCCMPQMVPCGRRDDGWDIKSRLPR